jgi:diacylglycerol O-acyltransferase / wax synthase
VNDVFVAIVAGALRKYLSAHGELPVEPLVAMVPISTRDSTSIDEPGNQVSAMYVALATDVADPVGRLAAIGQAARQNSEMRVANYTAPPYNTVITNVPGPQQPLYSCGARLVAQYGLGMVHDAMGLMHAIQSYCGEVTISFMSDREMMRDPAFYAECLEQSHAEYAAATRNRGGITR